MKEHINEIEKKYKSFIEQKEITQKKKKLLKDYLKNLLENKKSFSMKNLKLNFIILTSEEKFSK